MNSFLQEILVAGLSVIFSIVLERFLARQASPLPRAARRYLTRLAVVGVFILLTTSIRWGTFTAPVTLPTVWLTSQPAVFDVTAYRGSIVLFGVEFPNVLVVLLSIGALLAASLHAVGYARFPTTMLVLPLLYSIFHVAFLCYQLWLYGTLGIGIICTAIGMLLLLILVLQEPQQL